MEFISVDNVMDHLAGEERCNQRDPRERRDTQSISTSQEKQLKSKRGMRGSSQEERWRKVYRIVFVLEESADTPSPCKFHDKRFIPNIQENLTMALITSQTSSSHPGISKSTSASAVNGSHSSSGRSLSVRWKNT